MVSDSVNANTVVPPKDLGNKKKRVNRNARLKQCKLDARREQWLSQVGKIKGGCKEERNREHLPQVQSKRDLENLEVKQRAACEMDHHVHHHEDSDFDSISSSPSRAGSVLSDKDMESNFTSSCCSGRSSPSSSGGSCSGILTETEEDEDEEGNNGCMDDWEAVADALEADEKQKGFSSEKPTNQEPVVETDSCCKSVSDSSLGLLGPKPNTVRREQGRTGAWRFDDASRPHCLPNLSKQFSLPNSNCFPKPPCPICCEDLDETELNFLPCLCGFRLCLFCHKRILEEDGRCPGCRNRYEKNHIGSEAIVNVASLTIFGRSCSMITRS